MQKRILHLDMDAFFASVEILDQPRLKGKCVLVGGTGGRSVVAACSYAARKFGVHSAMPMRKALELCPRAIVLRPRFERYSQISKSIFSYLQGIVPLVERTSIDEGYMDISEIVDSDEKARLFGQSLKSEILERTGLVCSVGIAPCMFASKIASDLRKPDALVVVPEGELIAFLDLLDVGKIPGVGKVAARKLHDLDVKTIADLRRQNRNVLKSVFGKWGDKLYDFARGIDPRPVIIEHERKSLGTEETFESDVQDPDVLRGFIRKQAEKVAKMLRTRNWLIQTVTLKLRYSNFQLMTRQRTFSRPIQSAGDIAMAGCDLLDRTEATFRAVRLVGISVSGFVDATRLDEMPLFQEEIDLFGESK